MKAAQSRHRIRIPHPLWLLGLSLALILLAVAVGIGIPGYRQRLAMRRLDEARIGFTSRELAPDWTIALVSRFVQGHIELLPEITAVYGTSNQIREFGIDQLSQIDSIEDLQIYDGNLTASDLRSLCRMRHVQNLGMDSLYIEVEGLESLRDLASLEKLNLSRTNVSDEGLKYLGKLSGLRRLEMNSTQITEAGLWHLSQLKNLQWLNLDETPIFEELLLAIDQSDSEKIWQAIQRNPVLLHAADHSDHTLLHLAAAADSFEPDFVKRLIDAGASLELKSQIERTVIEHVEWQRGYLEDADVDFRLRFLLQRGAEFTLPIAIGLAGTEGVRALSQHPLSVEAKLVHLVDAAEKGRPEVLKVLLTEWKLDPNRSRAEGVPLIYYAASHPDVIRVLAGAGANVDARIKSNGGAPVDNSTTLHVTARLGETDSAEALLDLGALVDAQNDDGWTPLIVAAFYGKADVVSLLIRHGADQSIANRKGDTALSIARQSLEENVTPARKRIVEILQSSGKGKTVKEKPARTSLD